MKRAAVLNPTAGRGRSGREAASLLGAVPIFSTSRSGEAFEIAQRLVNEGYEQVIAVGGDGTVSEVANALAGTEAGLALLPLGTGNDLARTLGVFKIPAALAALEGERQPLDAIRWTCAERTGLSVNVAGAGFDAVVAERINQGYRGLSGTTAYLAAVVEVLMKFRPNGYRLLLDGEEHSGRAMLTAFANSRSYGGGMLVAPNADWHDGLLDAVVIGEVSRFEFLRTFPKVFSGKHLAHPAVMEKKVGVAELQTEQPWPVLADGEIVGQTPARFEIVPEALRVWLPA